MDPLFEVRHLSAGYRHALVEDVSFQVYPGELVGILGRNGQGKTTLLRGITGDIRRFSGDILITGQSCIGLSVKKQAALLSVLPQKTYFPPGITVWEILEMGCYPRHRIGERITAQEHSAISASADMLHITALLETDCTKLSAGQQQMVLLCRMLVQNTPVMLLDEPNAALDYSNAQTLFRLLSGLVRREKKAAVLVVHDPQTALRWCDRLLLMDKGHVIAEVHPASSSIDSLQAALQMLYPDIRVGENPYQDGYICYEQEIL